MQINSSVVWPPMKRILGMTLMVVGFVLAAYFLYRTFSAVSYAQVVESFSKIPTVHLAAALGFAAASYACLTGFDAISIRYIRRKLPYHQIALASFVSLSIGHSVGMAGLSSGGIRYRYYKHWGLTTEEVAKIILFCGVSVGVGMIALAGIVILLNPQDAAKALRLGSGQTYALGFACLAAIAAYLTLSALVSKALKIWKWRFELPSFRLAAVQVVVATLNFALVSACLHQLVASAEVSYLTSATAFVLANFAVLITHAPGGLGVLEATVQHVMGDQGSIGALVAFRIIYFFIPLLIGLPLSLMAEAMFRSGRMNTQGQQTQAAA
jgi:uncharacterized membrane protein YbhN (UPF0104 family)